MDAAILTFDSVAAIAIVFGKGASCQVKLVDHDGLGLTDPGKGEDDKGKGKPKCIVRELDFHGSRLHSLLNAATQQRQDQLPAYLQLPPLGGLAGARIA